MLDEFVLRFLEVLRYEVFPLSYVLFQQALNFYDVRRCRFYLLALKCCFSWPFTAIIQEDDARKCRFYLLALKFCFSRPLTGIIQEGADCICWL